MTRFLTSWGPALFFAGIIFYLSSQSDLSAPEGFQINDKVAHVILYAVFGMALAWAGRHYSPIRVHAVLILLGILYGVADEIYQSFVPFRESSSGDLVADAIGVVVGYLLTAAFLRARNRQRKQSI